MKPVWIVDDDKSIRWVLEKTLSREQIPFKSFASASEALAQLDLGAEPPQVLVSDIRMPVMDGMALVRAVHERKFAIPIILVSGFVDAGLRWAHGLGVEALMEKPLTRKDLLLALEHLLTESSYTTDSL